MGVLGILCVPVLMLSVGFLSALHSAFDTTIVSEERSAELGATVEYLGLESYEELENIIEKRVGFDPKGKPAVTSVEINKILCEKIVEDNGEDSSYVNAYVNQNGSYPIECTQSKHWIDPV